MANYTARCPKTGRFYSPELADDGTMDTVIRCPECGAEARYNYDSSPDDDGAYSYDDFVTDCKADMAIAHIENDDD